LIDSRVFVSLPHSRGGRNHFFRLWLPSCSKILNPGPDPGPTILQIWESDSCSDSGCNHRSNRNLPMFLPRKWPHRLLLLPNWKSYSGSGSGFSQIFDSGSGSGSERKTQNPAGVDSGYPDPVPPLPYRQRWLFLLSRHRQRIFCCCWLEAFLQIMICAPGNLGIWTYIKRREQWCNWRGGRDSHRPPLAGKM